MELNLTNMKDLEIICDAAAVQFAQVRLTEWAERAHQYRVLFRRLIAELEDQDERERTDLTTR